MVFYGWAIANATILAVGAIAILVAAFINPESPGGNFVSCFKAGTCTSRALLVFAVIVSIIQCANYMVYSVS